MILDTLENYLLYLNMHPLFGKAFDFLRRPDLKETEPGRYELQESSLIAIVEPGQGKTRERARLESHRKYIDIQYTLTGAEEIGWKPRKNCQQISRAYNPEKDIEFYADTPDLWLPIPSHHFAIFFPHDAHAPLAGNDTVHKVIMKVALN